MIFEELISPSTEHLTNRLCLCSDIDQVGDTWNGLLLHDGGGAEQCSCGHKKDIAEGALAHFVEDITAQHRGTASAARSAGVDVLIFIKDHHAAVAVALAELDPFFTEQITQ